MKNLTILKQYPSKNILIILGVAAFSTFIYYLLVLSSGGSPFVFADTPINACDVKLQSVVTSVATNSLSYDMTVTNQGLQICNSASLTVYYTNGETVQSTVPKATSGNYYWKLGNLAPDQSVKVTINSSYSGNELNTEACATANNGSDSCFTNTNVDEGTPTPLPVELTPPQQLPTDTSGVFRPKGEYGMWVWESPVQMSDAYRTQMLNVASATGINVVYVTIDDYLAIYNLPAGTNRTNKLIAYNEAVGKLIDAAKLKNIGIDAEAGWKDWSDPAKRANSYNIIDYVSNYNATNVNGFRKLQFDVEPYLLSTYENNKASVLTTYVNYLGDISTRARNLNLDLSLVIPHFYDSAQKWTPTVNYNGKVDYTFNHILRMLDLSEGNDIIIMAYRNTALGKDSTVQISQQEVKDASTGVHSTKVIVAQEMGDVDPSYVTYYGKTRQYLWTQLGKVDAQFKASSGYNGISLHYYEPFTVLR